jgi:hypothetical protein
MRIYLAHLSDIVDSLRTREAKLRLELEIARSALVSIGIERDHWKATAQALLGNTNNYGQLEEGIDGQVLKELRQP